MAGRNISSYCVDFGQNRQISTVELYFFGEGTLYKAPTSFAVQYRTKDGWLEIHKQRHEPQEPLANGRNRVTFSALESTGIRIVLQGPAAPANLRLIEVKAYAPPLAMFREAFHRGTLNLSATNLSGYMRVGIRADTKRSPLLIPHANDCWRLAEYGSLHKTTIWCASVRSRPLWIDGPTN